MIAAGRRGVGGDSLRSPDGSRGRRAHPRRALAALRARNGAVLLTDDHAPVETLMAPVFLRAVR